MALLLRALRIDESLWYDEIAMWLTYGLAGPGAIVGQYFDPVNHIAHTLTAWASVRTTAPALGMELALRLPSLLASLATVPIVYALCRGAFAARTSAIAAGLIGVLPVTVFSGVEARGYAMVVMLTAASTWALIEARRRGAPGLWALYALLAALTVWTHMVAVCVFLGHGLWIAWAAWRDHARRQALVGGGGLALAAALTLLLYAPVLPEVMDQLTGDFQLRDVEAQPALWGEQGMRMLWQLGGAWQWWAAVPGLALVGLGAMTLWRDRRDEEAPRRREVVALLWLGLPVMLVMVALLGTWVYARFALFVMPAAAVTMALGIEGLWRWRGAAAMAALALMLGLSAYLTLTLPPKQPLREATQFVAANRAAHEEVLSVDIGHAVLRLYAEGMPMAFSFMHGADLPQQLAAQPPAWIIVLYPEHLEPAAENAMRSHGYRQVQHFRGWLDDGDVLIYRRP